MVRAETNSAENGGDDQWLAALKEQAISFEGTQLLLLRSAMTGSLAQQESRVRQQLADARAILLDLRRVRKAPAAEFELVFHRALIRMRGLV